MMTHHDDDQSGRRTCFLLLLLPCSYLIHHGECDQEKLYRGESLDTFQS